MEQISYSTIDGFIWECSKGHKNSNRNLYCNNCNEKITCKIAGGHYYGTENKCRDCGKES